MALTIGETGETQGEIKQGWMPARQRLALGIPLHPDRMSREDWVTLPGIGEKLAAEIERDRQNYGDFGRFEALERVKGIGPAKLKALRPFFVRGDNLPK
jgi:competence protein ComEA